MTATKDMFLPGNRNEWTSMVRPPDGYRIDGAIGTTYGLDFTALTAILLAILDQQSDRAKWGDHAHLLQAITRLEDRVRVVVHRGQIHADVRPSNKVFALFDRMVCEAKDVKGNFHPKVWILKYLPRRPIDTEEHAKGIATRSPNDAVYRLLCTSRNVTLASTWEAVVCIDGRVAEAGEDASMRMGQDVSGFFAQVLATRDAIPDSLGAIVGELQQVAFSTEGSKSVQSCEFRWQWPGMPGLIDAVPSGGKIGLIVSPFVRGSFLKRLAQKFNNVIVISCQQELDKLWCDSISALIPLENFWVVKTDHGDDAGDDSGDNVPPLNLHAKLLLCEYAKHGAVPARTEAWLGSANASDRAWGLSALSSSVNCEAMVRFRPGIRPEQFLDQFAYRDCGTDRQLGEALLNGWIEQYQPQAVEEPNDDEKAETLLELAQSEVSASTFHVHFARDADHVALTVSIPRTDEWKAIFSKHEVIRFEVCPLGLADGRPFRNLKEALEAGIQFDSLSMAQASAFLLIQLTHIKSSRKKQFVVKATTEMDENFWNERRVAFLRENVNAREFREFLRSILFEGAMQLAHVGPGENGDKQLDPETKRRSAISIHGVLDDFSVEDILHACTQDRSRIEEIDRLLKTFEGTQHVDDVFREFWVNFRQAIQTAESGAPE